MQLALRAHKDGEPMNETRNSWATIEMLVHFLVLRVCYVLTKHIFEIHSLSRLSIVAFS